MGELMARAVYEGVQQALRKQNGLSRTRSIFQRLRERKISLWQYSGQKAATHTHLERLLLQERYASFMAASLAISDDFEHGLIRDLSAFESWSQDVADSIAGRAVHIEYQAKTGVPAVINRAMSSLVSAVSAKATGPATEVLPQQ